MGVAGMFAGVALRAVFVAVFCSWPSCGWHGGLCSAIAVSVATTLSCERGIAGGVAVIVAVVAVMIAWVGDCGWFNR